MKILPWMCITLRVTPRDTVQLNLILFLIQSNETFSFFMVNCTCLLGYKLASLLGAHFICAIAGSIRNIWGAVYLLYYWRDGSIRNIWGAVYLYYWRDDSIRDVWGAVYLLYYWRDGSIRDIWGAVYLPYYWRDGSIRNIWGAVYLL